MIDKELVCRLNVHSGPHNVENPGRVQRSHSRPEGLQSMSESSVLARWSLSNLLLTLCRFVNTSHGRLAPWVQPYTPNTHTHTVHAHILYTHTLPVPSSLWRPNLSVPLMSLQRCCSRIKSKEGFDLQLKWIWPSWYRPKLANGTSGHLFFILRDYNHLWAPCWGTQFWMESV